MTRWKCLLGLTVLTFTLILSTAVFAETPQAEADVLTAQGVLAYDDRHYEQALALLQQALTHDPKHPRALYYTGLTNLALKQPVEAITALETAKQVHPTDPSISYQLGVAYFTAGRYDDAAPLFEQAFNADPSSENLGYYVGLGRYRQKQYKEAIEAFKANQSSDVNVQQLAQFYRGLAGTGHGGAPTVGGYRHQSSLHGPGHADSTGHRRKPSHG